MSYRPYPRSMASIHDLAHLATLSDVPGLALFLSPRTLYVLQNFVLAEATRQDRYASELVSNGYFSVEEGDATYDLFLSVVDGIKLEVMEMPDVIDLLTDIKDLLAAGISVHNHGWAASQWREDAPRLGHVGGTSENIQNLNASAGYNDLASSTPDGEVWTIEAIHAERVGAASGIIVLYVQSADAVQLWLASGIQATEVPLLWNGQINLYTGDTIVCLFGGCNAGDDIYLRWFGHRAREV